MAAEKGAGAAEKCAERREGAAVAATAADTPSDLAVRQMLAARSGTRPEDWHLTFKARQAMRVACDAIATAGGREVATQLFTCCTAVDPITSAGLVPRFCDIDPDTLAIPTTLAGEPSAVMLQHTCGLMAPEADAALASTARARGAVVLEDCAHCVGRLAVDAEGKPLADLSFHSFGVEKMLPTHFGGAVWVNPGFAATSLGADVVARLEELPALGHQWSDWTPVKGDNSREYRICGRQPRAAPSPDGQRSLRARDWRDRACGRARERARAPGRLGLRHRACRARGSRRQRGPAPRGRRRVSQGALWR